MPELPEVETVRGGLAPVLEGRRLARVEARRPDLRFPLPENFVQVLTGATIEKLERRAKYLLARLDREDTLVMHLGMSGRFEIARPEGAVRPGEFHYAAGPDPKHAHIVFETDAGDRVTYYDPRRFGYMAWSTPRPCTCTRGSRAWAPSRSRPTSTPGALKTAFAGRKQGPKTLLLDQRIVAGLGNIYVCEALHRARISPFKPPGKVSLPRLGRWWRHPRRADRGHRRRRLDAARLRPDGRGAGLFPAPLPGLRPRGRPCPNDGCNGVIARKVQAGRSTFFCPVCQV
jgi:formamidopyrimidine-DNA glycosylase